MPRRSRLDTGAGRLTREGAGPRATVTRRRRAVETYTNAAETLGPIEKGAGIFCLTRGQFSMIDAIQHCARSIGPCHVSVWTWVTADYDVETIAALLDRRAFLTGRLVVDRGASAVRSLGLLEAWRERYGPASLRVCHNHAKMARLWNEDRKILLRGSFNLNFNPRFEQVDLTEGGDDFDLVAQIEADLPELELSASRQEIDAATGIGKAWEISALKMFDGVKPWQK